MPDRPAARAAEVLRELEAEASPANRAGMARYGIVVDRAYGVSMPRLRALAKRLGRDHDLALALWDGGVHEARILATLVDEPRAIDEAQMERWVLDLDSWDLCDQLCGNLFTKLGPLAYRAALEWSGRGEEFVKRSGFVLAARLAVQDKKAADSEFLPFLDVIEREAADDRNFVKKAVSWSLRQIGKRSAGLNAPAVAVARRLHSADSKAARWVGRDALRELESAAVRERLGL